MLSALLTVVMCFIIATSPLEMKSEAADSQAQSYQDKIATLSSQQKELKKKLDSLKADMSNAMAYKNSLDELANVTQSKIVAAEALAAELELNIKETTASIAEKEEQIKITFNNFLERMRISYEEGEASYLAMLLGSEDMSEFLSRMDRVTSMLEYDKELKEKYESEKTVLESEKQKLEEAKVLQEENLATLKTDQAEYDTLLKEQESYISSLQSDLSSTNAAYEAAKKEENKVNKQLEAYLASLQQQNNSSYVGGEFMWPLKGYSYVSSGFGWRTIFGRRDNHLGIDIPAPGGTPIYASNGGTVVTATGSGSYGNYVVIDHGGGKSTLYAHMSRIGTSVGQKVGQGQVIGYVGTTGYSTGNHLHFEVRINGKVQNPMSYVRP